MQNKQVKQALSAHRINDGGVSRENRSNLFLSSISNQTPHDSALILGKADPDPKEKNEKISCYEEGRCPSRP